MQPCKTLVDTSELTFTLKLVYHLEAVECKDNNRSGKSQGPRIYVGSYLNSNHVNLILDLQEDGIQSDDNANICPNDVRKLTEKPQSSVCCLLNTLATSTAISLGMVDQFLCRYHSRWVKG